MKISLLQLNVVFADARSNLDAMSRLVEDAMHTAPDVLVLPELWNLGFFPTPIQEYAQADGGIARNLLSSIARHHHVNVIGGTVAQLKDHRVYNTCYIFSRNGDLITSYNKAHLFHPMQEDAHFTAGSTACIFDLDGLRCAVAVCYDLRFSPYIARLAAAGIQILFLPAAWPSARLSHWQILTRARAIEHQIFVAACNETGSLPDGSSMAGHSVIIDPLGNVLKEADMQQTVLTANINPAVQCKAKKEIPVQEGLRRDLYESIVPISPNP